MKHKTLVFFTFVLMVAVQIYIPIKMISASEDVLHTGKEFSFRTAPVDPNDPFRGKYITLFFKDNTILTPKDTTLFNHQTLFVHLKNDPYGYAKIHAISKQKPTQGTDYVQVKIDHIFLQGSNYQIQVAFPFNIMYLEEFKAEKAEEIYREVHQNRLVETYASVYIKNGNAILKDLIIDNKPIREIIELNSKK